MTAPLIPCLPLIEGETLSGLVSRSAALFETTPRDYCTDLGMRWPFLCSGYQNQLQRLSWLTDVSVDQLEDASIKKVGKGLYKVGRALASIGTLRRTAVRLCPQCVAPALLERKPQNAFQMLEWTVLCIHRCARHGCALITLPSERHAHATYDFATRVRQHKAEVLRASADPVTLPPTSFETYIVERLRGGPHDDWLKNFDLTQLHRACLNLGAALSGARAKDLRQLPELNERNLVEMGFKRLVAGPEQYKGALEDLYRQGDLRRPFYSSDMGPFYKWLSSSHEDPALTGFVDMTCAHVFETYPIPEGKEVFGRTQSGRRLLTIEEARKRSGFGAVFLKRLLGHIEGVSDSVALNCTEVHVDDLKKAQAYWDALINLKDAASLLGILPHQVKSLQDRGVLKTIKITSALRYVLQDEVVALLAKARELPIRLESRSVVSLREFCLSKGVPLPQILELWSKGDLDGLLCRGAGIGLQSIEIDWDALCDRQAVQLNGDLTLPEAARYLKISVISIRRLRDSGFLREIQHRNPDTNHLKSYITEESIRGFERRFSTLGQMATTTKIAPIHLARKLDKIGVNPVTCANGPVRVYDKSSLPNEVCSA